MKKYAPVFKPYPHQANEEANFDKKAWAFFWEMGLGKSKALIDNACWLWSQDKINGLLILAPKGVYLNWLRKELPEHMPKHVNHRIAYWNSSAPKKERMKAAGLVENVDMNTLDIMIVNVEAIRSERGLLVCKKFLQTHYAMMGIDESQTIKSHKSQQTKAAWILGTHAEYRRVMSGTPVAQSPLDIWGQAEFLQKGFLGFRSYTAFKANYAIEQEINLGNRRFKKITGYTGVDDLSQRIARFASRLTKDECLDLPEKIWTTYPVELTDAQRKAYNELVREAMATLDDDTVTSASALTTMMRLHQINCGHVMGDAGGVQDLPNNRVQTVLDILEEREDKVIIWGYFQRDIELLQEAIAKRYGPKSIEVFYGPASDAQRDIAKTRFLEDDSCRFLVASYAMAKGHTFVNCNFVIYYSVYYAPDPFLQSQDRTHRIGQTKPVTYVRLQVYDTVDEKVWTALEKKKSLADDILDNWRDFFKRV